MPNTGSDATFLPHSSQKCPLPIDPFTLDYWPRRVQENEYELNDSAAHNIRKHRDCYLSGSPVLLWDKHCRPVGVICP